MAKVQIFKVEFLVNSGSAVIGDVLDIFVETDDIVTPAHPLSFTSTGIFAELNGVLLVGDVLGYSWILLNQNQYSLQRFSQQVCSGTSLIVFGEFPALYPYATYYSQENHYSCAVNPPTCDLLIVGVPNVIPATDAVTADGSIEITATSTNPIQYKIGSDFVYGDGTGQSSNFFSGLLPGSYRIFLRDDKNCQANILVTVTVNNTHGAKYFIEYEDQNQWRTRLELTRRGYTGSMTEICHAANPFIISQRGEGEIDKFLSLLGVTGECRLMSESNFQFIEFFTSDPNLYRVKYYKDLGVIQPASDPFTGHPFAGWTNQAGGGPDWTTGANPSVVTSGTVSDFLRDTFDGIPSAGTYDFSFDADSTGNASISIKFYKDSIEVSGGTLNALSLFAGNNTNTFPVVLSEVPDEVKVTAVRSGIVGTPTVTLNSFSIDIPEISGFQLKWTGKVIKNQYQEPYRHQPYDVSIKSIDGLAELSEYYLVQPDGQTYAGTISLVKLVAHCLGFLKMDLNINVGCNMYASGMNTTAADDPFEQSYIDFECFYIDNSEPTIDYILASIVEPFGARVIQWDNAWWIVRIEEMAQPYNYRTFDKDGVYVSSGTYSPVKDLGFPQSVSADIQFTKRDQNLEIVPSYGLMRVIYKLGLKPNLLFNGDFRIKPSIPGTGFEINKSGFTLVNAGYSIAEGYEIIDEDIRTVAYTLQSYILDATASGNGGQAYLQSAPMNIIMGTNNTLRINFRYKISSSYTYINFLILQYFKVKVPYIKVRTLITFEYLTDTYYLTGDGRWTLEENEVVFFVDKEDEFIENELTAIQPPVGANLGQFKIRFYIPFAYYTQFDDIADLKAFETYDGSNATLPNGYRTEWREEVIVGPGTFQELHYYVLEENTDSENIPSVVRPDDYHATNNPRQWISRGYASTGDVSIGNPKLTFTCSLDRIRITYLTDGKDPQDSIIRVVQGEASNNTILEKTVIIGSYSSLIVSIIDFSIDLGVFFPGSGGGLAITTTSVLSAYLLYTGYLRDSSGTGWQTWARDGIAEEDSIHGILLKGLAAQYKSSSRLLRGSFLARDSYFGFLDIVRELNDSNRLYLPMSLSLNDKRCEYTGAMIELKNIYANPGSDGSSESPYNSAFSTGFGADFN